MSLRDPQVRAPAALLCALVFPVNRNYIPANWSVIREAEAQQNAECRTGGRPALPSIARASQETRVDPGRNVRSLRREPFDAQRDRATTRQPNSGGRVSHCTGVWNVSWR